MGRYTLRRRRPLLKILTLEQGCEGEWITLYEDGSPSFSFSAHHRLAALQRQGWQVIRQRAFLRDAAYGEQLTLLLRRRPAAAVCLLPSAPQPALPAHAFVEVCT